MTEIPTRSIAQLPVASSVNGNDQLVISQGGITKSAIASQLRAITTTLSVTDDLYVGRDAFISGRTTTGTLRVIGAVSATSANFTGAAKVDGAITAGSTVSAVSDIYTNRDAFVSGRTTTGTLNVIGAVSAASVNITGALSVMNGANIDHVTTVSTVLFSPVSEGSAAPTSPGQLRFLQTTASVTGRNGVEFLSSTFGSGYGFNLKCIDDGSGATVLGFAKRRNNVAWSLAGYYDDLGNFVWSSGTALATNATTGFLYIPSCSGVPSGVPVVRAGAVPIVMDIVGSKLYAYRAGAWSSVSLA